MKNRCLYCGNNKLQCCECKKTMTHQLVERNWTYALLPIITNKPLITFDESAKEDMMNMMDWSEKQFNKHTIKIVLGNKE